MGERTELRFAAPQITISLGSRSETLRLEKLPDLGFCIPSGFDLLDIGGAWGKFSAGFPDDTDIHFIGKADGTVAKVETTVSAGLVKGVFAEFGEFVLLTDVDNAGSGTSPKTGDVATTAMLAMLVLSAGAAFVSVKKIKA